jgi:steroid delta-isomerase-like uncharacterized protein
MATRAAAAVDLGAIASSWFQRVWNEKQIDAIDELSHPDVVIHAPSVGIEKAEGPAAFKEIARGLYEAIPDVRMSVDEVLVEGDRVALRLTVEGTHTGSGMGIPPTGKRFRIGGIALGRYRDGKLVEGWNSFDNLGFLQQLGLVTLPAVR